MPSALAPPIMFSFPLFFHPIPVSSSSLLTVLGPFLIPSVSPDPPLPEAPCAGSLLALCRSCLAIFSSPFHNLQPVGPGHANEKKNLHLASLQQQRLKGLSESESKPVLSGECCVPARSYRSSGLSFLPALPVEDGRHTQGKDKLGVTSQMVKFMVGRGQVEGGSILKAFGGDSTGSMDSCTSSPETRGRGWRQLDC